MAGLQRSTIATIAILGVPTVAVLAFTLWDRSNPPPSAPSAAPVATPSPAVAARRPGPRRRSRAQGAATSPSRCRSGPGTWRWWSATAGLTTQPGSAAAAEGLNLKIVFIEDAPSKNKALQEGKVDAVWETVDELPIAARRLQGREDRRARVHPDRLVARRRRLRRQQGGAEGRGRRRTQGGRADVLARPHGARVHADELAPHRPTRWRRSARTPASRWTTSRTRASCSARGRSTSRACGSRTSRWRSPAGRARTGCSRRPTRPSWSPTRWSRGASSWTSTPSWR